MKTNTLRITGILLAGGMSSRMGTDKGSLKIGRKLLYEYPLAVLEKICGEVLISTCNDAAIRVNHRKICDEIKGIGPIGGIYSCLKQSSSELNLVLSYDMPLVNDLLLRALIKESESYEMVLPALIERRPEPLCGLYRKSIAGLMKEMISQNDFAVNHLLTRCRSRIVPVSEEMECWQPDLFLNINSREDLQRIPPGFGS